MNTTWFLIINPTAGNRKFHSLWYTIQKILKDENISYVYETTTHHKHGIKIVQNAINQGYKNFISIGGDGTLHHIVNGVMNQKEIPTSKITIAVIPIGTGNDWAKTYSIPKDIKKAILVLKNKKTIHQDIGLLTLNNTQIYFNNIAGIGFDGYVVSKLQQLKKLGRMAYLISALKGLLFYKKKQIKIETNNTVIQAKSLMTVFGICKYSGGGMLLTNYKDSSNGLLDITIVKNFTFIELLFNIKKLYTGQLLKHSKVTTLTTNLLTVTPCDLNNTFIQADGELVGTGPVTITICKQAIQFVIP